MTSYKVIFQDGEFFICNDLSDEHIKNLKMCDIVASVVRMRKK